MPSRPPTYSPELWKNIAVPSPPPAPIICDNSCVMGMANDGICDDGGPGSTFNSCYLGTDCDDCRAKNWPSTYSPVLIRNIAIPSPPPAPVVCDNSCVTGMANDGICDDGGPGSTFNACYLGTDCDDCSPAIPTAVIAGDISTLETMVERMEDDLALVKQQIASVKADATPSRRT